MLQYVIGLALCVVIAFLYSSTRKEKPRDILRDGLIVLAWMVGALSALAVFCYAGSHFV